MIRYNFNAKLAKLHHIFKQYKTYSRHPHAYNLLRSLDIQQHQHPPGESKKLKRRILGMLMSILGAVQFCALHAWTKA